MHFFGRVRNQYGPSDEQRQTHRFGHCGELARVVHDRPDGKPANGIRAERWRELDSWASLRGRATRAEGLQLRVEAAATTVLLLIAAAGIRIFVVKFSSSWHGRA